MLKFEPLDQGDEIFGQFSIVSESIKEPPVSILMDYPNPRGDTITSRYTTIYHKTDSILKSTEKRAQSKLRVKPKFVTAASANDVIEETL
jgi:hypothetical protein